MQETDPAHEFHLKNLDGPGVQRLRFVKRVGLQYPGNLTSYPGTTSQDVLRCLITRARYINDQIFALETWMVLHLLRICLWLLEFRAARRHGLWYFKSLKFAETAKPCDTCHHTLCKHL